MRRAFRRSQTRCRRRRSHGTLRRYRPAAASGSACRWRLVSVVAIVDGGAWVSHTPAGGGKAATADVASVATTAVAASLTLQVVAAAVVRCVALRRR